VKIPIVREEKNTDKTVKRKGKELSGVLEQIRLERKSRERMPSLMGGDEQKAVSF